MLLLLFLNMRPSVTLFLLLSMLMLGELTPVRADVGTAASYGPPYLPTKCNGYDQDQFPPSNMFAAVSDALWDNGAACGRSYMLRCLSGPNRPCKDSIIRVEVVDQCTDPCPANFLLSTAAFTAVSRFNDAKINVEFAQYVDLNTPCFALKEESQRMFHNECNLRIGIARAVIESIIRSFKVPKPPVLKPGKNDVEANGRVYGPSAPLENTPSLLQGMEPGVAAQEARWSSFGAEDSEIMAQLLGPFSCTNEQAEKDLSFGLSSMSWSSDHAADSYDSSSENVSSFFGHCSGYESYYLSEPNTAPAINTSSASASASTAYCVVGDQLIIPSLRLIPNPSFGDPTTANEETSSDDAGDSSFNFSEPVPQMTLPKRKPNASEDDSPSDVSKKKAKAGANAPKNAKKAQSKRPQKTTKSSDDEDKMNNTAANGRSSCSCLSEDDSHADLNGGGNTTSGSPALILAGKARADRGSATDPQSLYARVISFGLKLGTSFMVGAEANADVSLAQKRRERINERLKILQNLVPNGTKVDISTMLEEAVQYVKFLQLQIKLLSSDELWMYAPIAYNGMNIGLDLKISPPQNHHATM
ncbi:hypothetical protein MUK42_28138 [Musa troglodytarum]|uniref:BHLH domain-containing protein n=2 Tax=Musa troglodytarum TaxID=320322 RepID=A0A9E7JNQ4_9LILI|nr:hypothetical protein MUK42_28138 [Musa troglodytarum]